MWYVEDVYAKNLNCYRLAWDGDDYGLIRACEDRIFDRRAGRDNGPLPNHKRSFTKQSKKRRDRGMQTPVGAAPPLPAEPVKKAEVKIASVVDTANYDSYGDDSNATYYKLDWAWIFVGKPHALLKSCCWLCLPYRDAHGTVGWMCSSVHSDS